MYFTDPLGGAGSRADAMIAEREQHLSLQVAQVKTSLVLSLRRALLISVHRLLQQIGTPHSHKSCPYRRSTRTSEPQLSMYFASQLKLPCPDPRRIPSAAKCVSPFRTKEIAAHPRAHDDQHSYYDKNVRAAPHLFWSACPSPGMPNLQRPIAMAELPRLNPY